MSPKAATRLALAAALTRTFGGAVLLGLLGAPGWFVAAWLIAGVRFRIGRRP